MCKDFNARFNLFLVQNIEVCYADFEKQLGVYFMLHPMIGSVTAIIAGIIILIYPSILNYVVAIYLILTGLIGIFGT